MRCAFFEIFGFNNVSYIHHYTIMSNLEDIFPSFTIITSDAEEFLRKHPLPPSILAAALKEEIKEKKEKLKEMKEELEELEAMLRDSEDATKEGTKTEK